MQNNIEHIALSGLPTSTISASLASADIKVSHLFLASAMPLSSVDPDRSYDSGIKIYRNQYESVKMSYSSLSSHLLESFKQVVKFKSMAYEESACYSLVDHVHNYSKVELTSNIAKEDLDGNQNIRIGTIEIDGSPTTIYMESPTQFFQPDPEIGQLKFLAVDDVFLVDEFDSAFDGWTWPDGRTISNTSMKFADAAEHFAGSRDARSFQLPNLCKIFRPPDDEEKESLAIEQEVQRRDVFLKHDHQLKPLTPDVSEMISVPFSYHAAYNVADNQYCHTATKSSSIKFDWPIYFDIKGFDFKGGTPKSNIPKLDGVTMPTHTFLLAMIYIGKPS